MIRVERLFVDMEPSSILGTGTACSAGRAGDLANRLRHWARWPQSNIEVFMQRLRRDPSDGSADPRTRREGADYRIDHLRVSVGEVVVQDRRGLFGSGIFGGEQRVQVDAVIEAEDVTDLSDVLAPLLTELRRAGRA